MRAKFYGNRATKILHSAKRNKDACRISEVNKENRITFDDAAEPKSEGYRPCKLCWGKGGWAAIAGE